MSHYKSRGWFHRVITVTLLTVFVPLTTTACFGSFPTLGKVYSWNKTVNQEKWVRWLIFLLIGPVYGGATAFDLVFSNSVEFWTGKNPMAAVPGTTRHVEGPSGERAVMTLREDRAIDVRISAAGKPEEHFVLVREVDAVAAYDADGVLIARVGDGPDGQPMLLAGTIGR